ncbi:MAG: phosphotransferase, partial [Bacteroidota bacterium]
DSEGVYAHSIVCPEGIRHYVLFNFAPGKVLTALNPETAESFGVQLGKIHDTTANLDIDELSRSYLPLHLISSTREVLRTRFDPSDNCHNKLNSIADILSEKLTPEIIQQLPVGICHGDPHYENAIFNFEHQKLTFIDFDFCGHGHLLYDLGSFFYYERERPEIQSSFLIGYQSVRTMSAVEISLIPYFQILMQLFHLGARATHADGIKSPLWHDDQIIEKLDTIAKQLKGLKEE